MRLSVRVPIIHCQIPEIVRRIYGILRKTKNEIVKPSPSPRSKVSKSRLKGHRLTLNSRGLPPRDPAHDVGENWFQYRCYVNSHKLSLYESVDFNMKASEFSCPLYTTTNFEERAPITAVQNPVDEAKDATITRLKRINAQLQADKNQLVLDNSNARHTALTYVRHNSVLLGKLEDTLLDADTEMTAAEARQESCKGN